MAYTTPFDPEYVYNILLSAANFNFHLRRSSSDTQLATRVTFECYKLATGQEFDKRAHPVYMPTGDNLNDKGLITVYTEEDKDAMYGFKLTNMSYINMYAYVFYFDISDFTIGEYYRPGAAKNDKVEYSLPKKQSLTIGYGSGGQSPQDYFVRPEQELDVGYIKVFLSTQHIDFSSLGQDSPFLDEERASRPVVEKNEPLWDRILITVLQKRTRTT